MVQLKCEANLDCAAVHVAFTISVGCARRGPAAHDFSEKAVCEMQEWDLGSAVDPATQTFTVSLELAPHVQLLSVPPRFALGGALAEASAEGAGAAATVPPMPPPPPEAP